MMACPLVVKPYTAAMPARGASVKLLFLDIPEDDSYKADRRGRSGRGVSQRFLALRKNPAFHMDDSFECQGLAMAGPGP